jgi:ElaB/YqjD/DUF883 family membrane-anchored ribosome-binding protein
MSEPQETGHEVGPEIDDSQNPTSAAPAQPESGTAGREMLAQLQSMIDTLAVQARPVMREVAAKAAELAAVAGERAGPLAHKVAERTQEVGQKVAVRSKDMAADLRRPRADEPPPAAADDAGPGSASEAPSD